MNRRFIFSVLLVSSLAILAACDSAEERAEKHFEAALEFIENGDFERATVEFRNVFELNGKHEEARLAFAQMQQGRGNLEQAYSQYLRLVEQQPEHLVGRRALAEMAIEQNNWDEAERHGRAAADLDPENPAVRAIVAGLDYREAVISRDLEAQEKIYSSVQDIAQQNPDLEIPLRIIIDTALRNEEFPLALSTIDSALLLSPGDLGLYRMRLGVLNSLGQTAEIETQLQDMIVRFPDEETIKSTLLTWYLSREDIESAENFLRDEIDPEADRPDAEVRLVRFLAEQEGPQAARVELDELIASETPHRLLFRSLRAALTFEMGEKDAAIEEMHSILEQAEPSADTNNMKATLARMLEQTGNAVGARALVEEVLSDDRGHVESVKLKARWLIASDETDDAINILREALGQSPRDSELMTLLANAHERNGNRDLMADMLALAVEASGAAPEESLRYADHLVRDDKALAAESVLLNALRLVPNNPDLLTAVGRLYLRTNDWGRLDGVVVAMQGTGNPDLAVAANELTAQKLSAQNRSDDLQSLLSDMARDAEDTADAATATILGHIRRNDLTGALNATETALEDTPQDSRLNFIYGVLLVTNEQIEEGEAVFRKITQDDQNAESAWLALYRIYHIKNDSVGALAVLEEARAAMPNSQAVHSIKAALMEEAGDFDGAIAIYDELYNNNSSDFVIANNLASLLATHYDDAESLERAWAIARRLRGIEVPQFQDTFGWIAYRRGNHDEALSYLESAAAGLPDDPLVQYHLAAVFAALGRHDDARAQLETANNIAKTTPNLPNLDTIAGEITRLLDSDTASDGQSNNNN